MFDPSAAAGQRTPAQSPQPSAGLRETRPRSRRSLEDGAAIRRALAGQRNELAGPDWHRTEKMPGPSSGTG